MTVTIHVGQFDDLTSALIAAEYGSVGICSLGGALWYRIYAPSSICHHLAQEGLGTVQTEEQNGVTVFFIAISSSDAAKIRPKVLKVLSEAGYTCS